MSALLATTYPEKPDNQRFMRVSLRDASPVDETRGALLPGEADTPIRDYYKYELADKYQVDIRYFREYYLHAPDILPRLVGLGYDAKKTRLLSRGMVKIIFEIHGKP